MRLCFACADPVATEDGGMSELSASCESTIPAGLTPKQRLAWKKEEERRRRELELQVCAPAQGSAANRRAAVLVHTINSHAL